MNRPALTLEYFARLFAAERIRWVIAGALAANVYRLRVRTTADLDLLVDLSEQQYASLRAHLEAQSWQVHPAGGEPPEPPDLVQLRHAAYFPTDLLVAKTDYQQVAISRARVLKLASPSVAAPYLSPEDVVVQKLIAYRFRVEKRGRESFLLIPLRLPCTTALNAAAPDDCNWGVCLPHA